MQALNDLKKISRYAGERFDLVQAGGGNSSVKLDDGRMLIKASGFLLSDVTETQGFSTVNTQQVAEIVKNKAIKSETNKQQREVLSKQLVERATEKSSPRPSIETLLHALLDKFTLHTHPLMVNIITMRQNWRVILSEIFLEQDFVCVDYQTPGIDLALELDQILSSLSGKPNIIFLQNHGLIVTDCTAERVMALTDDVIDKIASYLGMSVEAYQAVNEVSALFNSLDDCLNITYLSEDNHIKQIIASDKTLLFNTPFCPDVLVYCGVTCVELVDLTDSVPLTSYQVQYHEYPKVILYNNNLYLRAPSIKKAREIEELFKFSLIALALNTDHAVNFLGTDELAYLGNWEAEKFRQNI